MSPAKPVRRAASKTSARARKAAPAKPKTLRESVAESVKSMTWLAASDQATVDLALTYAGRIDAALSGDDPADATKALYLGPHLLNALRALGGAPAERKALGAEEVVGGKLAQLRSIAGGKAAGGAAS